MRRPLAIPYAISSIFQAHRVQSVGKQRKGEKSVLASVGVRFQVLDSFWTFLDIRRTGAGF
jgi:hypothetical protein